MSGIIVYFIVVHTIFDNFDKKTHHYILLTNSLSSAKRRFMPKYRIAPRYLHFKKFVSSREPVSDCLRCKYYGGLCETRFHHFEG